MRSFHNFKTLLGIWFHIHAGIEIKLFQLKPPPPRVTEFSCEKSVLSLAETKIDNENISPKS